MPVVFRRIGFVSFRINIINGFNKIVSLLLPAGTNLVLFTDFNDQKRLVLPVFEFHTQFLSYPELINIRAILAVKCPREKKTLARSPAHVWKLLSENCNYLTPKGAVKVVQKS